VYQSRNRMMPSNGKSNILSVKYDISQSCANGGLENITHTKKKLVERDGYRKKVQYPAFAISLVFTNSLEFIRRES